ncbi:alpha/beta hydrolase family protein [Microbulbifer sp. TRSA001]|uniref:alpha/beta hydrolase family protein n=1 Tax=Microbulbifer sp. TRSA001 TaxID=3243381 RepID=UPI00403A5826
MRKLIFLLFLWPTFVFSSQIPLNDLIRHADIQEVKISPTGTHIAIRKLHEGERVLIFMSLETRKVTGLLRFRGEEEVGDFFWANHERVVAEIVSRQTSLETPVTYGSLYAINYDNTKAKNIFGHSSGEMQTGTRFKKAKATYAHADLVDPLIHKDKKILISTRPWAQNQEAIGEILELDIYSGIKKKVAKLPEVDGVVHTDNKGNIAFATGVNEESYKQLYQMTENGWKLVDQPVLKNGTPVGSDPKTGEFYLTIYHNDNTEQLIKVDTNSMEYESVFQHEISDIEGIIYNPKDLKPLGVYLYPDYPEEYFFDDGEGFSAYFRGLKKAFDGYNLLFTSFTTDGSLGILKVYGDRLPGDYFLVNTKTKKVDFLISSSEWLDPQALNPMVADSFITEDKLRIGTYLTFPKNKKENLPMVVIPHGGPHSRDYWTYNQTAQILSMNGYLVLQMNFRGSTGYGGGFYTAGEKEWGNKIQQDIADSVKWAIEKGYADPERICIYGASFGGYSALMNPIRHPNLYKCAAGYVGIYNLEMMYTKGDIKQRDRGIAYLNRELSRDENFLNENSPLYSLEKLNLPIFLIHGEEDQRAPFEHAKAMVKEFKKMNKPVKTLFVKREGHGFYTEENNMKLYTELLEFLDEHIGIGAAEKQPSRG